MGHPLLRHLQVPVEVGLDGRFEFLEQRRVVHVLAYHLHRVERKPLVRLQAQKKLPWCGGLVGGWLSGQSAPRVTFVSQLSEQLVEEKLTKELAGTLFLWAGPALAFVVALLHTS
ncbi:hypothetical protein GCM10027020_32600 [Nocardioides salsibiostraticola]